MQNREGGLKVVVMWASNEKTRHEIVGNCTDKERGVLEKYDLKSISVSVVYFFVVNDGNGPYICGW